MTDLTEQWEKGELPEGCYYCEITLSPCIEEVFLPCVDDREIVVKVLDKKPSYKEVCELKNLLKEIRGKIHYINTPKNRHNIFDKYFIDKIDEVLK